MSEHIENCGGVYYITKTRISLDSIVYAFRQGSSPETIREDFEGLALAHIYGAIAFYLDNQTEVEAYLSRRKEQFLALEREGTRPPRNYRAGFNAQARQFCLASTEGPIEPWSLRIRRLGSTP